ncbi:Mitochondrial intermediate peptidase, mitochondrial [Vitis vinifera]|uniref:Mitochondrial intermediate peptidase, mitochondrial n=1 Tax=Vitis vinifera TaxID=29760 RepID=A0A438DIN0_VITVI|nr:Mitochondrial intermediate peptidase, mitochondrial [Vitis vinifera]
MQIMGYKSYAEFAVRPNMASSPEVVMSFLFEMSKMIRPKADEEFKAIRDFKKARTGQICEDLEPWDEAYFTGMMKSSAYNLDSSVVASYFPLHQCIEGLKVLVESLFGATFRSILLHQVNPGIQMCLKCHYIILRRPQGLGFHFLKAGDLGYLYLDLCSRKDKYPGCAHFAIKGGRRLSETEYQLPGSWLEGYAPFLFPKPSCLPDEY